MSILKKLFKPRKKLTKEEIRYQWLVENGYTPEIARKIAYGEEK